MHQFNLNVRSEAKPTLQLHSIPYTSVKNFSALFSAYTSQNPVLNPLISAYPNLENFKDQIKKKAKQFGPNLRLLLQNRLKAQMDHPVSPLQEKNLDSLTHENTFSVSCGHQLNLAGGPVYVAFKILTVIALAEKLNREFPDFHFVPVHWLATEDHDRDEICAFRFLGKSHTFSLSENGAVGRMGSADLMAQMNKTGLPSWMADSYTPDSNLTQATRKWLQQAFGNRGLLVIDGDDPEFKNAFFPLAIQELTQPWVEPALNQASATLNQLGFKEQIHARPVNLFYLREGERLRLEAIGDTIRTTEGEYQWTRDEAISYFKENPLCLSPNVAFRPLYSQLILPDVAFIGGPAELAYWLQLGQVFEQAKVPFPILLPRFSGLYVNQKQVQKMKNLNIKPSDFFKDWTQMKRDLFVPEGLIPDFEKVFSPMMDWAKSVDVTLVPAAHAELTRMRKQAEHLQNRIRKAAERRNEIQISQIKNLFEELFPNGNLQERTESWLSFVVENPDWLDAIFNLIDPLDMQFQVILEDKPGSAERAS